MWAPNERPITYKYNLEISVLDILKHSITLINSIKDWLDTRTLTAPSTKHTDRDVDLVWWAAAVKRMDQTWETNHHVYVTSKVSFSSSFSSLPSPWCENFRGCNADVLVRISKTSIDREEADCLMVTVLDLCVFSPHWSASERKWEGECESHFKHLLWVWSIPKVQVSILRRECGARGGGEGEGQWSVQVLEGERTRQSNG